MPEASPCSSGLLTPLPRQPLFCSAPVPPPPEALTDTPGQGANPQTHLGSPTWARTRWGTCLEKSSKPLDSPVVSGLLEQGLGCVSLHKLVNFSEPQKPKSAERGGWKLLLGCCGDLDKIVVGLERRELRALGGFSDDPSSFPSIHLAAH